MNKERIKFKRLKEKLQQEIAKGNITAHRDLMAFIAGFMGIDTINGFQLAELMDLLEVE